MPCQLDGAGDRLFRLDSDRHFGASQFHFRSRQRTYPPLTVASVTQATVLIHGDEAHAFGEADYRRVDNLVHMWRRAVDAGNFVSMRRDQLADFVPLTLAPDPTVVDDIHLSRGAIALACL